MPNRNTENHFGNTPTKSMPRSAFKMGHSLVTTMNTGDIVPIYWKECLAGDSCKMNVAELVRMTTPINPVMDNAYIDTYFFKVPLRLVDEHFEEMFGENKKDAWTQTEEFVTPKTQAPEGGWTKGSLASYFGMPQGVDGIEFSSHYLRSYVLCFNEWFRNQNVTEPAELSLGQETTTGSNGTDYVTDLQKGGAPAKAVKFADYFTRALPEPQKGPDVFLPLGQTAPIITGEEQEWTSTRDAMLFRRTNGTQTGLVDGANLFLQKDANDNYRLGARSTSATESGNPVVPSNLYADLSTADGATINQLRQAFAIQRLYELDANGTRFIEIIQNHFKVRVPDARLQRPEYVGGKRVNINMQDVLQHSSTDETSPLGHEAGESKTIDNSQFIETAFVEPSILLGLAVIRTDHSYQQGIERAFSRTDRLSYYWPELANLGEQQIKNKEIFAQGTSEDDEIFGYQEAWAEYRYEQNIVTGEMNSNYETPLDSWHYADDYTELPTLSDEWIRETRVNVDRTLAIQNQDQFKCSFYFDSTWYRPLPIYSIPSLTGWH